MTQSMAAHPETLRIIQAVHDTVRDTVVRVTEPSHEPVKSFRFFGQMSPFDIIVAVVGLAAGIATIIAVVKAFHAYADARRKVLHHLRAHIAMARNWVIGPTRAGWNTNVVTPAITLTWSHPRRQQIPLFSASPLSQVTLLQNVFLPQSLTEHLVLVAQSIETLNDSIAQYNAFKTSNPSMFLNVERKLDAAAAAVFPPDVERYPEDMTHETLARIMATAELTPDEDAWSDALFQMLRRAHLEDIGDATGQGLFRHLQALELEFARAVDNRRPH